MHIWYDQVYKPSISAVDGYSGLLLSDLTCRKSQELKDKIGAEKFILYMNPKNFSLLQPYDFGTDKALKDRLKKSAAIWRRGRHSQFTIGEKLPDPEPAYVLLWLKQIWD